MTATRWTTFPSARQRNAGFTLMEILIALTIFGVGLIMAASLFPAGVSEHEKAVEDTLGTIMCNNGLAIARTQLRHDENSGLIDLAHGTDPQNISCPQPRGVTPVQNLRPYPSDNPTPLFQFAIQCCHVSYSGGSVTPDLGAKFSNKYTITITPFRGGFPIVNAPTLTVTSPLPPLVTTP